MIFIWFLALPGFMPFVFAALAQIDGQHGVEVRGDREHVVVVLTHGGATSGKPGAHPHVHGALSRMLAAFTISSGPQPDHVATFTGTCLAPSEVRTSLDLPNQAGIDIPAEPWTRLTLVAVYAPRAAAVTFTPARSQLGIAPLPARRHSLLI